MARMGSRINWPVAVLAVSIPTASPLLFTNHLFAIYGLNTVRNNPDPRPMIIPQITISCHEYCILSVSRVPVNNVAIEIIIIFFKPSTSIKAAIKGPDIPYKNKPTAKAREITDLSQPNSFSNGSIKTPEDDLTIPATIIEEKEMSRIIQL